MNNQFFISSVTGNFNLRSPKSDKPTTIFFVVNARSKQYKFSTGVKILPRYYKYSKNGCLYLSNRMTELDRQNSIIANERLSIIKDRFSNFLDYLSENPDQISNIPELLTKYIYNKKSMNSKSKENVLRSEERRVGKEC